MLNEETEGKTSNGLRSEIGAISIYRLVDKDKNAGSDKQGSLFIDQFFRNCLVVSGLYSIYSLLLLLRQTNQPDRLFGQQGLSSDTHFSLLTLIMALSNTFFACE